MSFCSIPLSRNAFDRVADGFQNGTSKVNFSEQHKVFRYLQFLGSTRPLAARHKLWLRPLRPLGAQAARYTWDKHCWLTYRRARFLVWILMQGIHIHIQGIHIQHSSHELNHQLSKRQLFNRYPKATACSCANNGPCELGSAREKGGSGQPCLWWSQVLFFGDPRHFFLVVPGIFLLVPGTIFGGPRYDFRWSQVLFFCVSMYIFCSPCTIENTSDT